MAYNARKTYNTQKKYNRQAEQLDTTIKGLVYQDQAEIQDQVEQIIKGWENAAKGGKWGTFLEVLDFATNFIPGQLDDVLVGTAKAANYDRLRAKALKGLDLSQMQYLNKSAQDASFEIKQQGDEALEDLKFGNQMKDVGLDLVFDAIMESETMEDFMEKWKYEDATGPAGEDIIQTADGNFYIPGDIPSYESMQDVPSDLIDTPFKVEDKAYIRKSDSIGVLNQIGEDEFLKQYGIKFEGDVETIDGNLKVLKPLKERFKPGQFLFGDEASDGLLETFLREGKDVLTESKADKIARQKYSMSNISSNVLGGEKDLMKLLQSLFKTNLLGEKL